MGSPIKLVETSEAYAIRTRKEEYRSAKELFLKKYITEQAEKHTCPMCNISTTMKEHWGGYMLTCDKCHTSWKTTDYDYHNSFCFCTGIAGFIIFVVATFIMSLYVLPGVIEPRACHYIAWAAVLASDILLMIVGDIIHRRQTRLLIKEVIAETSIDAFIDKYKYKER